VRGEVSSADAIFFGTSPAREQPQDFDLALGQASRPGGARGAVFCAHDVQNGGHRVAIETTRGHVADEDLGGFVRIERRSVRSRFAHRMVGVGGSEDASRAADESRRHGSAPWTTGQGTAGMVVDSANRVYVADWDTVYVVEGTSPSAYLTIAEAQSTTGVSTLNRYFLDMDIAPDGSFYLLTNYAILRSTAPHVATLVQSVTQSTRSMGVVGNGHVAVATVFDGLWSVTSAGPERRYTNSELGPARDCGVADIATTPSGLFLFEPACNPSALWRGHIDGSGVERMYEAEPFGINPLNATTFTCITRDPQGGFYVIGGAPEGPVLFHLCEGATRFAGYNHLPTTPSFSEAATGLAFEFCSIASAADGTLFVQTFNELWKVAPN
jgi:hypothetical protein